MGSWKGWKYGVVVCLDADRLVVDETCVFAAVEVGEVQGVAGELHAAAVVAVSAFGEEGVVVACICGIVSVTRLEKKVRWDRVRGRYVRQTSQMTSGLRFSYCVAILVVVLCDSLFNVDVSLNRPEMFDRLVGELSLKPWRVRLSGCSRR